MDLYVMHHRVGREQYVWIFDDAHASAVLRSFGRFAGNLELNFSLDDKFKCARELGRMLRESQHARAREIEK